MAEETGAEVVRRSMLRGLARRIACKLWRRISESKPFLLDYRCEDWLAEWQTIVRARLRRASVVHALWGDEQLDVLLRYRWLLPCPLVVTFHLPGRRVSTRFELQQKSLLSAIDLAVVVSTSQMEDFRRWLDPSRVVYIPHGIDTDRFRPGPEVENSGSIRLLTVGEHMRDWETLHRVIDICSDRHLNVEFDVVTARNCFAYFAGCKRVNLRAGIGEEELIGLYRRADALLLPVVDATACNAVLESLACGTPVISTAVGGIPDYVDESAGWLFKEGDVTEIVELIRKMSGDRNIVLSKRQGARAKSLEFDWRQVRARAKSAYATLKTQRR